MMDKIITSFQFVSRSNLNGSARSSIKTEK